MNPVKTLKPSAATTPAMLEPYKVLLKSEKFLNWKPEEEKPLDISIGESSIMALEKHYSVSEVAEVWGISVDLVRNLFRSEPDVLALDTTKRGKYVTLRIPESVMIRVHRRLSQG